MKGVANKRINMPTDFCQAASACAEAVPACGAQPWRPAGPQRPAKLPEAFLPHQRLRAARQPQAKASRKPQAGEALTGVQGKLGARAAVAPLPLGLPLRRRSVGPLLRLPRLLRLRPGGLARQLLPLLGDQGGGRQVRSLLLLILPLCLLLL
jgi:hypothetical protein